MWSCRISFVVSSAMSFFAFVLFRSVVALRSEGLLAYYDCLWWKSRKETQLLATIQFDCYCVNLSSMVCCCYDDGWVAMTAEANKKTKSAKKGKVIKMCIRTFRKYIKERKEGYSGDVISDCQCKRRSCGKIKDVIVIV